MDGRSRTLLNTVPVILLAGMLTTAAGCSSGSSGTDPSPAVRTPITSSVSVTRSPAPTPPTLPDAAKQPTRPGAEAFFRYFIDVYAYTYTSLDSTALTSICSTGCKFCANALDDIARLRSNSRLVLGGKNLVTSVAAAGEPGDAVLINALVDQESSTVVDGDGHVVDTAPAQREVRMDAAAVWTGTAWKIDKLHVFAKGEK